MRPATSARALGSIQGGDRPGRTSQPRHSPVGVDAGRISAGQLDQQASPRSRRPTAHPLDGAEGPGRRRSARTSASSSGRVDARAASCRRVATAPVLTGRAARPAAGRRARWLDRRRPRDAATRPRPPPAASRPLAGTVRRLLGPVRRRGAGCVVRGDAAVADVRGCAVGGVVVSRIRWYRTGARAPIAGLGQPVVGVRVLGVRTPMVFDQSDQVGAVAVRTEPHLVRRRDRLVMGRVQGDGTIEPPESASARRPADRGVRPGRPGCRRSSDRAGRRSPTTRSCPQNGFAGTVGVPSMMAVRAGRCHSFGAPRHQRGRLVDGAEPAGETGQRREDVGSTQGVRRPGAARSRGRARAWTAGPGRWARPVAAPDRAGTQRLRPDRPAPRAGHVEPARRGPRFGWRLLRPRRPGG